MLQVGKVLRQVAESHLDQQTGFIAFTLLTLHFHNLVVHCSMDIFLSKLHHNRHIYLGMIIAVSQPG